MKPNWVFIVEPTSFGEWLVWGHWRIFTSDICRHRMVKAAKDVGSVKAHLRYLKGPEGRG